MTPLEEAADLLRKAAADNERRALESAAVEAVSPGTSGTAGVLREVNGRRLEIAEALIRIAAISAGLPPCYHPLSAEHEQETP